MRDDADDDRGSHRDERRAIRKAIADEDARLRAAHPWLAAQDAIGVALGLAALGLYLSLAALALRRGWSPAAAVPLLALPLSVLHELEHDLFHGLYLRGSPRAQHLAHAVAWLARMTMNPWTRKQLHLRHHRESGQATDVEERLIGLGVRSLALRALVAFVPLGSALLLRSIARDAPRWIPRGAPDRALRRWGQRVDAVFYLLPFAATVGALAGSPVARALLLVYAGPNLLRHGSIALLSAASHYTDIPSGDVFVQNQVLQHWSTWPLQLFCCAFGATHVIHHYVVAQPFYLRLAVAPAAFDALRRQGARFDDLGAPRRGNRWALSPSRT